MERRRSFLAKCLMAPLVLALSSGLKPNKVESSRGGSSFRSTHQLKKALVLWYSQTGHTQRHARLIAHVWKVRGLQVTVSDIKEFDKNTLADFDLILVGSPVFYYDTPEYVQQWIKALPPIDGIPVAAFVTFGGPEGDQHNAVCTILELLTEKGGVPVGLRTFMNMSAFPLDWSHNSVAKRILDNRNLPDEATYAEVRSYADSVIEQVSLGYPIPVEKKLTPRRFSTLFSPIWWTKRLIDTHSVDQKKCTRCGICQEKCPADAIFPESGQVIMERCVLCFGCINNCPVQAVVMEYKGRKLFGFWELLRKKNITIKEPMELIGMSDATENGRK